MAFSKTAVIALSTGCFVAGLGAAYLITRNTRPVDPPSWSSPSQTSPPGPTASMAQSAPVVDKSQVLMAHAAPHVTSPAPATPAPTTQASGTHPARTGSSATGIASGAASQATPVAAPETRGAEPREARAGTPVLEPPPLAAEPTAPAAILPTFEELIVSADSVIGLQIDASVSSEQARIEDRVVAQVTRDVRVGDRVAIPSGAKAHGEVTLVDRGGRMRDRARLGVRFTSIVLSDGTRVPIDTDVIIREGSSPASESRAKIGGSALGGAIIGGILGGAKGAVIGGTTGAGAGTAAAMAGGRNAATLPAGTPVTVRLLKPTAVTVDK